MAGSAGSITSASMATASTCLWPSMRTVTMPPPAAASTSSVASSCWIFACICWACFISFWMFIARSPPRRPSSPPVFAPASPRAADRSLVDAARLDRLDGAAEDVEHGLHRGVRGGGLEGGRAGGVRAGGGRQLADQDAPPRLAAADLGERLLERGAVAGP